MPFCKLVFKFMDISLSHVLLFFASLPPAPTHIHTLMYSLFLGGLEGKV
jgi:hypothetical protein